jgi:citrate lyase beta subunit
MPLARSFLYVPANREKFLEKAIGLPSDAFIFDLEDSVPPAEKANARAGVREYAPKIAGDRVWVRVNGLDSGFDADDLDAVIGVPGLAGIFLPKVETPDGETLGRHDRRARTSARHGGRRDQLVISIERARRAQCPCHGNRGCARGVAHVRRAQDGDLNTDLGCAWSIDGPEMLHARSHALLAARAARFDTARRRFRRHTRPGRLRARHRARAGSAIAGASSSTRADRALQPALPPERGRARLLRARAGSVRRAWRRQRLHHRRRTHDRPRHGQRRAAILAAEAAWKKAS